MIPVLFFGFLLMLGKLFSIVTLFYAIQRKLRIAGIWAKIWAIVFLIGNFGLLIFSNFDIVHLLAIYIEEPIGLIVFSQLFFGLIGIATCFLLTERGQKESKSSASSGPRFRIYDLIAIMFWFGVLFAVLVVIFEVLKAYASLDI